MNINRSRLIIESEYSLNQTLRLFRSSPLQESYLLMLQHESSETPKLLINVSEDLNVDSTGQEMIQQSQNCNRKLPWKPVTKHLDGKDWEVYVIDRYSDYACHFLDGKIEINCGSIRHKFDAELATLIGHEGPHEPTNLHNGMILSTLGRSQHGFTFGSYPKGLILMKT
ncbi:hypothetical protein PTKIN_Ptkin12aG0196500 [Pterospermum kingtungense]